MLRRGSIKNHPQCLINRAPIITAKEEKVSTRRCQKELRRLRLSREPGKSKKTENKFPKRPIIAISKRIWVSITRGEKSL